MSHVPITAASTAAIAAAAAKAARERQEEEAMTGYNKTDLDGWEFKIMRSNFGKFKDYQAVQILCQKEAKAGWEMLEKFDNHRIRFKRRVEKRAGDRGLQTDPYRTQTGLGDSMKIMTVLGIVLLLLGLSLFIYFALGR